MTDLGKMCEEGQGIPAWPAEAASWYRKASDLGNVLGTETLTRMHRDGFGVARNVPEARRLFEKAISLGSKTARAELRELG
jgi:TPR repeat protein